MNQEFALWPTLFLLGAYHGINPGMGWLFAVARGMQEHRTRAVAWSLPPIALGHALSVGAVLLIARLAQVALPLMYIRIAVAVALVGLGVYKLIRSRHPRWGGMQVGFRDLTIWSFLMASAHGAGLMVLPVMLAGPHTHHMAASQGANSGVSATLIHTLGYFTVTAGVALLVYQKFGLAMLRRSWFNLDLIWAIALVVTGIVGVDGLKSVNSSPQLPNWLWQHRGFRELILLNGARGRHRCGAERRDSLALGADGLFADAVRRRLAEQLSVLHRDSHQILRSDLPLALSGGDKIGVGGRGVK